MAGTSKILRRFKDVTKVTEKEQWELVFEGLGCRIAVKENEQEEDAGAAQVYHSDPWKKLLPVTKSDFWGKKIPLFTETEKNNQSFPLIAYDVVDKGVFPSLSIEFVEVSLKLQETEETRLLRLALAEKEWAAITVILFLLCRCGLQTKKFIEATRRAVESRDWRYVHVIAVDFLKFHFRKNDEMLECLGLSDPLLLDRSQRTSAIRNLLNDSEDEKIVLDIFMKTIIGWCRQNGTSLEKWEAVLQTMEDFDCETEGIKGCFESCIGYAITVNKYDMNCLVELAMNQRKHYILRCVCEHDRLSSEQANAALPLAFEKQDWKAIIKYLEAGAEADRYVGDEPILHQMIVKNEFKLLPKYLPAWDINLKVKGHTLLHKAVRHWLVNCSGHIVDNILFLLENKADPTILYPSGRSVLQRLVGNVYHSSQEDSRRTELILAMVNSINSQGEKVDWSPEPESEWNALHVLCNEGDFHNIPRLLQLDADPFQHRGDLTLIDTILTARRLSIETKKKVLQILFEIPNLIVDHVKAVETRTADQEALYKSCLMFLLHMTKREELKIDEASHFELIKFLGDGKAFADVELKEALNEPSLSSLKEEGLDEVITYLDEKVALDWLNEDLNSAKLTD